MLYVWEGERKRGVYINKKERVSTTKYKITSDNLSLSTIIFKRSGLIYIILLCKDTQKFESI